MLTDEQVNAVDWSTKVNYLKRSPVTVGRQMDYVFKQLRGKVILNGIHPIGQLNVYDQRELQNRGTEHINTPIHIVDAPKIDENENCEVVEFIDKYIMCALPDETKYHEMGNLAKKCRPTIIQPLVDRKRV